MPPARTSGHCCVTDPRTSARDATGAVRAGRCADLHSRSSVVAGGPRPREPAGDLAASGLGPAALWARQRAGPAGWPPAWVLAWGPVVRCARRARGRPRSSDARRARRLGRVPSRRPGRGRTVRAPRPARRGARPHRVAARRSGRDGSWLWTLRTVSRPRPATASAGPRTGPALGPCRGCRRPAPPGTNDSARIALLAADGLWVNEAIGSSRMSPNERAHAADKIIALLP